MVAQLKDKTIQVYVGEDAIAQGLAKFYKAAKAQLADGFQAGQDLPPLAIEAFNDVTAAMKDSGNVGEELKADKGKLIVSLACAIDEIVD